MHVNVNKNFIKIISTIQSIEEENGAKLSRKSIEKQKIAENEELIAVISRIAISGSAAQRRRSEIIRTVKSLDQLTDALNREGI